MIWWVLSWIKLFRFFFLMNKFNIDWLSKWNFFNSNSFHSYHLFSDLRDFGTWCFLLLLKNSLAWYHIATNSCDMIIGNELVQSFALYECFHVKMNWVFFSRNLKLKSSRIQYEPRIKIKFPFSLSISIPHYQHNKHCTDEMKSAIQKRQSIESTTLLESNFEKNFFQNY